MTSKATECRTYAPVNEHEGRSDLANSRRFAELHLKTGRYCHPWKTWLIWDGQRWKPDSDDTAVQLAAVVSDRIWEEARETGSEEARKWAAQSARGSSVREMLRLAQSRLPVKPSELDQDIWLLNCTNGTLDLRTGQLRNHDPDDNITKLCPTDFDINAKAPEWTRFLESVFDGDSEVASYISRLMGYALTGDVTEQTLPIFWGSGANGKSTLLSVFMDVLGPDYAMKAPPSLLMARKNDSHPTEQADLFGMRLVACVESSELGRLNETLVKELTGGDAIRARRMHQNFWQFDPTHKLVLATNHRPQVHGTDDAIWRRLALIPFIQRFWNPSKGESGPANRQQDKTLPTKLRAEASGILAWAVNGCLDWQADRLNEPDSVKLATHQYRSDENTVERWLNECCERVDNAREPAGRLYAKYKQWCEDSRADPVSNQKFAGLLNDSGFRKKKSGSYYYQGLRVTQREGA